MEEGESVMSEFLLFKIREVIRIKRDFFVKKTVNKSCFVLSCRISGQSHFYFDDSSFSANRGDVLYIPYGSSYRQETAKEEVIALHLEAYSAAPNKIMLLKPDDPERVCELFEKCCCEFVGKADNYEYRCMALLFEILAQLHLFWPESGKGVQPVLEPAMRYLQAHLYERDFSIEGLCGKTGISRSYFNRLFKDSFGVTPLCYVNEMRIKKAKILLETGIYSNEEIAALSGFPDVKYFYVVFKRLAGQTTRQYIKNTEAKCTESTSSGE